MAAAPNKHVQNTNPRNAARRMHFFTTLIFLAPFIDLSILDTQLVQISAALLSYLVPDAFFKASL
jgi:hypothetical protein